MKKPNMFITSGVAAALLTTTACSQRQPEWNGDDNTRVCVDDDGDMVPMSQCRGYDDDDSGLFFMMWGSTYKNKYPNKYKSYHNKVRSSRYNTTRSSSSNRGYMSRSSVVTRGSAGSTGRSFSAGS